MIAKKVVLSSTFSAVCGSPMVGCVTIVAAADNSDPAYLRGDDGSTLVPLPKGVPFTLNGVDLGDVFLKGSAGDVVIVIGYTPSLTPSGLPYP